MKRSKLMIDEVRMVLLPPSTIPNESDPLALVKFFAPWMDWIWYPIEFDGADELFGLVDRCGRLEAGHFNLSELESLRGPRWQRVKQDWAFFPVHFSYLYEAARKH